MSANNEENKNGLIFIEPGNEKGEYCIGLNLLTRTPESVNVDAAKLMDVVKRLWGSESGDTQSWSPCMENSLRTNILPFLTTSTQETEKPDDNA